MLLEQLTKTILNIVFMDKKLIFLLAVLGIKLTVLQINARQMFYHWAKC